MRSSKARGRYNFRNHQVSIRKIIETAARRSRVTIHSFANVGNHLHLLVGFKSREACQRFTREVTGLIARKVTGARKGKLFGKFWDQLVHSRVVTGLRGFARVASYVWLNKVEGKFGTHAREVAREFGLTWEELRGSPG